MPAGINATQGQTPLAAPQTNTAQATTRTAPSALDNAFPSVGQIIGRALLSIATCGISEGIIAICTSVQSARAERTRVAEAQATQLAQANVDAKNSDLAKGVQLKSLDGAMGAAMEEGLEVLRQSFGVEGVPANQTRVPSSDACNTICNIISTSQSEVSPSDLKGLVVEHARLEAAKRCLSHDVENLMADANITGILPRTAIHYKSPSLEGLLDRLGECQNSDDVHALFQDYKEALLKNIVLTNEVQTFTAELKEEATTQLSEKTGLSKDSLNHSTPFYSFEKATSSKLDELRQTENPPQGEELKTMLKDILNTQMGKKEAINATVQDLNISEDLKQEFSDAVFTNKTYTDVTLFTNTHRAAQNINTTSLSTALQQSAGEIQDHEYLSLFQGVGIQLHANLVESYGDKVDTLDCYALANARLATVQIFLDQNQDFSDLLRSKTDLVDSLPELILDAKANMSFEDSVAFEAANAFINYIFEVLPRNYEQSNATLAADMTSPRYLTIRQNDAFNTAISDVREQFGAAAFPAGNTLEKLNESPQGKTIIKALQTAIKQSDHALKPQELHTMLKGILQNTASQNTAHTAIVSMAEEAGHTLSDYNVQSVLSLLNARYPDLKANMATANSADEVHALLLSIPDIKESIQFKQDLESAEDRVYERFTTELATALNEDPAELKKELDPSAYLHNSLSIGISNFSQAARNGQGPFPSGSDIVNHFSAKIQSSVAERAALLTTLPTLHGFQGKALSSAGQSEIRSHLLRFHSVRSPEMLQYFATIASRLSPEASIAALNSGNHAAATTALKDLGESILTTARAVIPPEDFEKMGSEELSSVGSFIQMILLDTAPDLHAAFTNNRELTQAVRDTVEGEAGSLARELTRMPNTQKERYDALTTQYGYVSQTTKLLNDVLNQ